MAMHAPMHPNTVTSRTVPSAYYSGHVSLPIRNDGVLTQLIEMIREISIPVIPVHDQVLVLPLVGTIDSARSNRIMETLLTGVQKHSAQVVIIDITGVPLVDTGVANHRIQATQAATLLGAHCVLVGASPEVAQTLVQLGVSLSTLVTLSNLQAGVTYALSRRGRAITAQPARMDGNAAL
jgi:rsbT co-antagonist protein RsbR